MISAVLAVAFSVVTLPAFPPFSDAPSFMAALVEFIGQLLALAAPIMGLAYLIYNVLLQKVLEVLRVRVRGLLAKG